MSEAMQQHAVDCVAFAFQQKRILDDIAEIIKTEFDTMYQPTWHCIVGRGMGSNGKKGSRKEAAPKRPGPTPAI